MQDRVYQGMTIAFDFSVEEIWVPWMAGATLVPKPAGSSLLGLDLHEYLTDRRITALCCVPTLLATIEEDLPLLRFLLVSGEACPQDLIVRWHKPGRRFLNVYGPTEATVTATWTVLHPDRPVTIGQPLPTYTTVILDPENPKRALPHGEVVAVDVPAGQADPADAELADAAEGKGAVGVGGVEDHDRVGGQRYADGHRAVGVDRGPGGGDRGFGGPVGVEEPAARPTSSATSSTRRARPAGRKAWRSRTPASATSSVSRPRSTASRRGTASTRA